MRALVVVGLCSWAVGCQPPPAEGPPSAGYGEERAPPPERATARLPRLTCDNPTIVHATVVQEPRGPILDNVTIELSDGVIRRVLPSSTEPTTTTEECVVDVAGRFVLAGFWNAHVHFTDPAFNDEQSAETRIREMLFRYGFTSVVDTGADPRVLQALREAIANGHVQGPRILVAGGGFVYTDGTPSYLPKGLLPELATPDEAAPAVQDVLDARADGIKIFSGSFQTPTSTIHLPLEIIRAVTDAAHERGAFVVSHPTDREGFVNAVDGGVDILAHTAPPAGELGPALLERMVDKGVAPSPIP